MSTKRRSKKPYEPPTLRPITKPEAERIAGGPEELAKLGTATPSSKAVVNVQVTVVAFEGNADPATMRALGELVGNLMRRGG